MAIEHRRSDEPTDLLHSGIEYLPMTETIPPVQLFATCLIDSLFPEVGVAVVKVLNRAGRRVILPNGQTCCGQPAFNAGFRDDARIMAKNTIEALESLPGDIVIPSGSCTAMVRHGYAELFASDPEWLDRANQLASRSYELSEYLVDVIGVGDLGANAEGRLAYHPSCHLLRELGVSEQPRQLLTGIKDATIVELEAECCGFGGLFAVEQPEISTEMLKRRLSAIEETGAKTVVGCDVSCLMQIEGGLRRANSNVRCAHIAQVLANDARGLQ
jgi:L-lactate dehydrogenase complex protein LldE